MHSEVAWQYPMHLVHWLHENLNLHPGKSTTDIMINKFKYLKLDKDKKAYIITTDPDIILYTISKHDKTRYSELS